MLAPSFVFCTMTSLRGVRGDTATPKTAMTAAVIKPAAMLGNSETQGAALFISDRLVSSLLVCSHMELDRVWVSTMW